MPEHTIDLLDRLEQAHHIVRDSLQKQIEYSSTWCNKRVREQTFVPRDRVRVYNAQRTKGKVPKWQCRYHDVGEIVKKLNDSAYVVKCKSWRANKIVHVAKLKREVPFRLRD